MNLMVETPRLMSLVIGAEALFFLYIGLRGLIRKQPFAMSTRTLLVVMLVGMLPAVWGMVLSEVTERQLPSGAGDTGIIFNLMPVMLLVMAFVMWLHLRGYIVYGVTMDSFRDGLHHTLDRMQLPYQESVSGFYLPSVDAHLNATVSAVMGTAQLQMKQRRHAPLLAEIAAGMNDFFRTSPGPVNLLGCSVQTALGALMLAMAFGMAAMFNSMDRTNQHFTQLREAAERRTLNQGHGLTAAEHRSAGSPAAAPSSRTPESHNAASRTDPRSAERHRG